MRKHLEFKLNFPNARYGGSCIISILKVKVTEVQIVLVIDRKWLSTNHTTALDNIMPD
jgi:hypothetical protein